VLDGEAVMEDATGASDFFALHAALARKSAPEAILYAFDLLELNGTDLRSCRSWSAGRRWPRC
jgi:bifunctional non-homologous end joining protein LigD